ncbi:MAG: aminotransferase class V-fold PLP-dependent enzyme [Planctomycetota bacterium]|nr:aminotransferase class V-fold PLP-dependent enzyme [Planctomycetota bacterium]
MSNSRPPQANDPQDTPPRPPLDPDAETMRSVGYALVDRLVDHHITLSDQPVARRGTRHDFASLVDEDLPDDSQHLAECLEFFFQRVVPDLTLVNHPRFHGYIPCPSSFAGALGAMLAAGTNPFSGSWLGGSTVCALELTVLRWIKQLLNYPLESGGIFTSGGSLANLVGLAAARTRGGDKALTRGVIYVSPEGHASLRKSASVLGFPRHAIRSVPTNREFQMDVNALQQCIARDRRDGHLPLAVAATAGTTNSGAIDPLTTIADICVREDVWFHIDAAYGGFAALSPRGKRLLQGLERADSLTLDPHKWLYCPMGIGCALVRDANLLESTFSADGEYLADLPRDEINFLDRGPELSRPARVIAVWMVLRSAGRAALAQQIDHDMQLAQLAADLLRANPQLEVNDPVLSIVTFGHRQKPHETEADRAERDTKLMEATLASGELMLSTTTLANRTVLRMVIMNHRTTAEEVQRSVSQIHRLAR